MSATTIIWGSVGIVLRDCDIESTATGKNSTFFGNCSEAFSKFLHASTGDQVIVIAEDDDSYSPLDCPAALPVPGDSCPPGVSRRAPERVLFCGWRRDMHDMIAVLDAFVYPGSELWLYNEVAAPAHAYVGCSRSALHTDRLRMTAPAVMYLNTAYARLQHCHLSPVLSSCLLKGCCPHGPVSSNHGVLVMIGSG